MPTTKNIIIFTTIATILVLVYVFFIKKAPSPAALTTSVPIPLSQDGAFDPNPAIAKDFLTLLLSVKNIKLNDAIFSDNAFNSLRDSSITLTPDGNEGRTNPFAPLGIDNVTPPGSTANPSLNTGASTLP